ncbi:MULTISPECIES: hypothetical protein [Actinoalloteichus]|uniref:Uncharacterized protein n=1 Tax=Actinoalloteichus fjordicus TaxID=1612552 RepID=A0AAC9PQV1_9PSEU|nr:MULTISPECIES: hypothetical protein [Actinoalloteichus]APU13161.1 hypothetical protein UA74_05425 [Actinoalloteichus fjordicus]APU19111.1 hypothetical protein UA75_05425 [Actinoalloteichus sp. GBA129-24]
METRPLRILLTINVIVFGLVCVAFLLYYGGLDLFPAELGPWFEAEEWTMWAAAFVTVLSGFALSLLGMKSRRQDEDR